MGMQVTSHAHVVGVNQNADILTIKWTIRVHGRLPDTIGLLQKGVVPSTFVKMSIAGLNSAHDVLLRRTSIPGSFLWKYVTELLSLDASGSSCSRRAGHLDIDVATVLFLD